jgi:hypothetical protein
MPVVTNMYFACIVRVVQVHAYEYLQQVSVNLAEDHTSMDLADFRTLVTDLRS